MRRYTLSELDEMNLAQLKAVCKKHRIKSDIKDFYSDESLMCKLIYKYRGKEEVPPIVEEEEAPNEVTEEEPHAFEVDEEPSAVELEEEKPTGFISDWNDERISFLQNILKNENNKQIFCCDIKLRDNFEIFKDIDVLNKHKKGYKVYLETVAGTDTQENTDRSLLDIEADIAMTNALIINSNGEIQAILNVSEKVEGSYYISLAKGMLKPSISIGTYTDFKILFFPVDFYKVLQIYNKKDVSITQLAYIEKNIRKLLIREASETEDTLFIDYGSYYATAATYATNEGAWEINQIYFYSATHCVNMPNTKTCFADSNCGKCGRCALCPCIIAVKDCSGDKPIFIHGHEAKRHMSRADCTVFIDFKRCLNTPDEVIDILDQVGNASSIKYSEIIKDYLQYIILCAERQNKKRYKNICILSQYKQKNKYLKIYKELLSEYNTAEKASEQEGSKTAIGKRLTVMDEAVSAIYHSLAQNKEAFGEGERKSVLFIDCGTNSSYMLRAEIEIKNRDSGEGSIFDMSIGYESGIPNFGGNKLTYRLMQYIKIKLYDYYKNESANSVKDLLGISYSGVYASVDNNGLRKIYEAFERKYTEVKDFICTNFNDYESEDERIILSVKRNFYFLWSLAEQIKMHFYENSDAYEFSFSNLENCGIGYEISIKKDDGTLEQHNECPAIQIFREEVNLLFKPEIYALLKKFIEPYYDNVTIYDIENFIFLGQTANIEIFRDVLKEYIAGGKAENIPYKKLKSVRGAAFCFYDEAIGSIESHITYLPTKLPYYLTTELFPSFAFEVAGDDESKILYGAEKELIKEGQLLSEIYSFIDRNYNTKRIVFTLKDYNKVSLQVFDFKLDIDNYRQTNEDQLKRNHEWLRQGDSDRQGDIDRISNNSLRVFVYGDAEKWGFFWLCIAKNENGSLYCGEEHFVSFDTAYEDYFDGKR